MRTPCTLPLDLPRGGYENFFTSCSNNKDQNGFSNTRKVFCKFFGLWVMVIGRGTFLLHLGCPVDNRSVFFLCIKIESISADLLWPSLF